MADLLNGIPRVDPTGGHAWLRWLRHMGGRVFATKPGATIHRRLAAPIDARLVRLTRGHVSSMFGTTPLVVLRTTGARSGAQRDVPLVYFTDGDDVILIASNYGQAKYPNWYYNLLKHPECELLADGGGDRGGRFIARPTEGHDHDRLYALGEGYLPNYVAYAARTNSVREIPVLRLRRKAPTPKGSPQE